MSVIEIFLIGVALSMDAFAVSISNGLSLERITLRTALAIALTFGIYQFAMPVIGYAGASFFYRFISAIDHWIAFALLGLLGGKMIWETVQEMRTTANSEQEREHDNTGNCAIDNTHGSRRFIPFKTLMLQGIATSIDALAVGISFAAMPVQKQTYLKTLLASAICPSILIGLTTTCLCLPAVFLGKKTGERLGDKAQLFGGVILVSIGVKILIEHLFGTN